jgi:hypothetical protein
VQFFYVSNKKCFRHESVLFGEEKTGQHKRGHHGGQEAEEHGKLAGQQKHHAGKFQSFFHHNCTNDFFRFKSFFGTRFHQHLLSSPGLNPDKPVAGREDKPPL